MIFILTGQTICVIFSKNEDEEIKKNPDIKSIDKNIFKLISEPESFIFLICLLAVIIFSYILNKVI